MNITEQTKLYIHLEQDIFFFVTYQVRVIILFFTSLWSFRIVKEKKCIVLFA